MKRPTLVGFRAARRARRVRVRPIRALSFNKMIPNILTLIALAAGMTAVRFAELGEYERAVSAIIVAGILDGLDGRVARLLKASSTFGAQLDSLSDFICFGVAPALVLHSWAMGEIGSIGWSVSLLFAICMALRLARFNTQLGIADLPPYAYNFFTGVPAPAAAGLAMVPLVSYFETGWAVFKSPWLVAALTVGIAGLMVSRLPTFSGKKFRVRAEYVLPVTLGVVLLAASATTAPWATLMLVGVAYLATFPLSLVSYRRLKAAAEALREQDRGSPDQAGAGTVTALRVVGEGGAGATGPGGPGIV